jgi:predicted dehydrogenase
MVRIGFIGYGGRISGVMKWLQHVHPDAKIAAIADPNLEAAKKKLVDSAPASTVYALQDREKEERAKIAEVSKGIQFFTDADKMLDQCELDGVMIGTRCSLHAQMAVKVAKTKLPLFLEKPVATTMKDLKALYQAFKKSGTGNKVVVSFPLRLTRHVQVAKEMIDAGVIGTLEHVEAVNNVTYGGDAYFQNWYRDWNETHGLWLQKATHDLDYVTYLFNQKPVRAAGMMSQRVLGPAGKRSVGWTMPMDLQCKDCKIQEKCPESPFNKFYMRGEGEDIHVGENLHCMFGNKIKNQDNGSCLVEYESGAHAVYMQNFFIRREGGARGATLIGYKGTIQFDWKTNELKVIYHHTPRVEKIDVEARGGHGGGDTELVQSFFRIIRDGEPSASPLSAGITSALLCMKVQESCETGKFVKIDEKELGK